MVTFPLDPREKEFLHAALSYVAANIEDFNGFFDITDEELQVIAAKLGLEEI